LGEAYNTRGREEKCVQKFDGENLKERECVDLIIIGMMVLKYFINKLGWVVE
jgi:hypothetical protein